MESQPNFPNLSNIRELSGTLYRLYIAVAFMGLLTVSLGMDGF